MIRTVIALDDDIKLWLDHRSRQLGISMTELVRQALREKRDRDMLAVDDLLARTSGLADGHEWDRQ